MTDAAIIYRSHMDAIENLPEEEQLEALKAIVYYCMDDKVPDDNVALCVLLMAKPVLDKWKSNRKAAQKGGQATNKQPKSKPQATAKQPESKPQVKVKVKDKVKEKDKDKDILSGKPDSIPLMVAAGQIIDHLNKKAGTNYKVSSRATVEMIKARLDEKWTVEDFFRAIDNMTEAWKGDPKMENYLRPATLFQRSKFESYVNWKPRSGTRFSNFPARDDQEHKDLVAKVIAMQ